MMYQPQKIYQAWNSQVEIDLRNGVGYSVFESRSCDRSVQRFLRPFCTSNMIDHVKKSGIQVHCGADTLVWVFMITHDVIPTL